MPNKIRYIILVLVLGLFACSRQTLGPEAYIHWVNKASNGLISTKTIGAFKFSVLFKPAPYVALEQCKDYGFHPDSVKNALSQTKGLEFYTFRVESDKGNELSGINANNQSEYSKRLQYFTSDLQNDIYLISGNDTLKNLLFHYERSYGVSPQNNFILIFKSENTEKTGSRKLVYEDKILGTGTVNLVIDANNINTIPELKLN